MCLTFSPWTCMSGSGSWIGLRLAADWAECSRIVKKTSLCFSIVANTLLVRSLLPCWGFFAFAFLCAIDFFFFWFFLLIFLLSGPTSPGSSSSASAAAASRSASSASWRTLNQTLRFGNGTTA